MIAKQIKFLSSLILIVMVGCSSFPFKPGASSPAGTLTAEQTQISTIAITPEVTETIVPTATVATGTATQISGGSVVRIWLPPEFDPKGSGIANGLLKARLDEYIAENPGVKLELRVKTLEGTGGMLESLVAANAAAPQVLPDLVLLPRALLESAALKGLLYPYDGLTDLLDGQSWFEYTRQLAHLKNSTYGIPFAGDALVLAHRPSMLGVSPYNLETAISLGEVLLYPAGDPQALFTLCMYLATGGSLQDRQGRPMLDEAELTRILEYDQRASQAGVMPVTLTEYADDTQVWEAFLGDSYPMAITWASDYIRDQLSSQDDVVLAPLPTPDGIPFTLATGWSWALAGQNQTMRTQSVDLAEFLVEKEFLAEWTYAAGYLPPRVDALQSWQDIENRQVIEQISYSAGLMPSEDLVASIGPALEQAVVSVLKAQSEPQTAAQAVIDQINQP
ncbi:MAG: extracellular solute-binding protein [Anaerolineales bacterium]